MLQVSISRSPKSAPVAKRITSRHFTPPAAKQQPPAYQTVVHTFQPDLQKLHTAGHQPTYASSKHQHQDSKKSASHSNTPHRYSVSKNQQ
ncbi:hypothetical protein Nepgr_026660 [Nepenthes gracilis]|uniref:Uncharacterized protein n=1 Tax=Nepenthes gracilis TaxID=150966 RepID=A0AAD3T8M1_NEPGR|nr:hypothetical protein Nepgr_026660 [Nepenthes gracilis]